MLIGYMRVTKADGSQATDLQRDALVAAGVYPEHLYEDQASGKREDRPGLVKGLLPEPAWPYGSIRRYGRADVARVKFVKSAQRLGFSLDEIAELLRLEDGTYCDEASRLAEHKLQDVQAGRPGAHGVRAVTARVRLPCTQGKCFVPADRLAARRSESRNVGRGRAWASYALAYDFFRFVS